MKLSRKLTLNRNYMKFALFFAFLTTPKEPEQPPKVIMHPLVQSIVHRPFPVLDRNAHARYIKLLCSQFTIEREFYINKETSQNVNW